jgi:hypothetical protein
VAARLRPDLHQGRLTRGIRPGLWRAAPTISNATGTLQPGRHRLIPRIEAVRSTVDVCPQAVDVTDASAYTADDVLVSINATVHFDVVDPVRAVYEIADRRELVEQTAIWALRNSFLERNLDVLLDSPIGSRDGLVTTMNGRPTEFGITVNLMRRALEALGSDRPDRGVAAARALREPLRIRLRGYDRHQVDRALSALAELCAKV